MNLTRRDFLKLCGSSSVAALLAACGGTPTPTATPAPTLTSLPTSTPLPTATPTLMNTPAPTPSSTAMATATKSLEQYTAEFRQSKEYQRVVTQYLEVMGLQDSAISTVDEEKVVGGKPYRFLVAVPEPAKLTPSQKEYSDIYIRIPLFIWEQNEKGERGWREAVLKDCGAINNVGIANTYYWVGKTQELFLKHHTLGFMWSDWVKAQPTKNSKVSFDFLRSDTNFSTTNQVPVIAWGIWPQAIPNWVKDIRDPREMRTALTNYVNELAQYLKATAVRAIVLLNEKEHYRYPDPLEAVLGDDYDTLIFDTFTSVYPECVLIYNDFENRQPSERRYDHTVQTARKLKSHGLKAIGVQFHDPVDDPEKVAQGLQSITGQTGLPVWATEMDTNIWNDNSSQRLLNQARQYQRKIKAVVQGGAKVLVFWGLTDETNLYELQAGTTSSPMYSRDADPMLFFNNSNPTPKQSFYVVMGTFYALAH